MENDNDLDLGGGSESDHYYRVSFRLYFVDVADKTYCGSDVGHE